MKFPQLIVTEVTALDRDRHFAVAVHDKAQFPIALCGRVAGALHKDSKAFAHLFADAPEMLGMLQLLVQEFGSINPAFPIAPGKQAFLQEIIERANRICDRHA